MEFEKAMLEEDISQFAISSYMRHLKSLVNHYMEISNFLPQGFKYPFVKKGGYTIKKAINQKVVMSNEDIKKVIDFQGFETPEQEYSRDIWQLSYWCNGMNYADIFRLKWTNIHDDLILFTRMKTENTQRNNVRNVVVPILPKLRDLIDKIGVKSSPYILGHLEKGYNDLTFRSQKDWQLQKIRARLDYVNKKLNLSVPFKCKTARDCYASTLQRAGYSDDIIDEGLGHAPLHVMSAHYKGVINKEVLFERNRCLVGIV